MESTLHSVSLKKLTNMNKIVYLFFLVATIGFFSINGCTDPCGDVVCNNGGICDEGICDCPEGFSGTNCEIDLCAECVNGSCTTGDCVCEAGYEGENCDVLSRDKFIGIWSGIFDCPTLPDSLLEGVDLSEITVNMQILEDPDNIELVILDAPDFPIDIFGAATIAGDVLTITPQTEDVEYEGIMIEVTGSGTGTLVSETTMDLAVKIESIIIDFDCTATLEKE